MLLNVERLREQLKVSEEELKLSKQLYEHEFAEKNDKIQHLNMQLESALTDVDIIRKDVSFGSHDKPVRYISKCVVRRHPTICHRTFHDISPSEQGRSQ